MADPNNIVKTIRDAEIDAVSLSKFLNDAAGVKVTRRLSTTIDTLDYYIKYLNALRLVYTQKTGVINVNGVQVKSVTQAVNDALDAAAIEGGLVADTLVTATPTLAGQIARTQRSKNSDFVSIKDFANVADAQAVASAQSIKIYIPAGEHEYDLTNADMSLFWGYGSLKDPATNAVMRPTNGDFVTPQMFGIKEKVDETAKLTAMVNYAAEKKLPIRWRGGTEYWYQEILTQGEGYSYDWSVVGSGSVVLRSLVNTPATDFFSGSSIVLSGVEKNAVKIMSNVRLGESVFSLQSVAGVKAGDLLLLNTTRLAEGENRGQLWEGQLAKVVSVDSSTNKVVLDAGAKCAYTTGVSFSGTISSVIDGFNAIVTGINTAKRNATILMTMTSGAKKGTTRKVTDWDNTTKKLSFAGYQDAFSGIAAGDTFTLTQESYALHIKPCKVNISGSFIAEREQMSASAAGTYLHRALEVRMADKPVIKDFDSRRFSETGVWLRKCYRPYYGRSSIEGANRGFGDSGTGYGVSVYECFNAVVHQVAVFNSRRAVDVGGSLCQTHDTLIISCSVEGGGKSSDGKDFFPLGDTRNSGFGTHGGGVNTRYIDCTANNVEQMYQLRGLRETINDCRAYGNSRSLVHVSAGGCVMVDNLQYQAGFSAIGDIGNNYNDAPLQTPLAFLSVEGEEVLSTQPITVQNCIARNIRKAFITIVRDSRVPPINYGGNTVYASGDTEFYWLTMNRSHADVKIENLNDMGGNRVFDPLNTYTKIGGSNGNLPTFTKEIASLPDTYRATKMIPAKSAIKINGFSSSTGIIISVIPVLSGRNFILSKALLYTNTSEDKSPEALTNKSRFVILNQPLVGGSGGAVPHLSFGVSYSPAKDGILYIENSTNREELVYIEVNTLTL